MRPDLRAELRGEDKDWHEGHLPQDRQHQRISQHEQLIAQPQLLVDACIDWVTA